MGEVPLYDNRALIFYCPVVSACKCRKAHCLKVKGVRNLYLRHLSQRAVTPTKTNRIHEYLAHKKTPSPLGPL